MRTIEGIFQEIEKRDWLDRTPLSIAHALRVTTEKVTDALAYGRNLKEKESDNMKTNTRFASQKEYEAALDKAKELLGETRDTYKSIAEATKLPMRKIEVLGLEYRSEEVRKGNLGRGGRDGVNLRGDREKAAELLLEGKLSYDEINALTGVPNGSLTKVREYALQEKALGLPITGRPVSKAAKRHRPLVVERIERDKAKEGAKEEAKAAVAETKTIKRLALKHSVDFEFEGDNIPKKDFFSQLDRIKEIIDATDLENVSFTIGVNAKGE